MYLQYYKLILFGLLLLIILNILINQLDKTIKLFKHNRIFW
jgi:hypothetical protein